MVSHRARFRLTDSGTQKTPGTRGKGRRGRGKRLLDAAGGYSTLRIGMVSGRASGALGRVRVRMPLSNTASI